MDGDAETTDYRILEEIEREIDHHTQAVEALSGRARILEVEVAGWRWPARRQESPVGWFVLGFLVVAPFSWFFCWLMWGLGR